MLLEQIQSEVLEMKDTDEYALIAWLREQAMEAHNKANVKPRTKGSSESERHGYYMEEKAYNKVIAHLQNSHVTEMHRKLTERD